MTLNVLLVTGAWAGLFLVFSGIGLGVRRCAGGGAAGVWRFDDFWVGWAVALAVLQVWHAQWAVSGWVLCAGAVIAAGVWIGVYRSVRWRHIRRALTGPQIVGAVLGAVAVAWLAHLALDINRNYDTGLYHAAAVKWTATYPAVKGLANLHGRLGFNSAYYLYAAMLETGPFFQRAHHAANGLLLAVLLLQSLFCLVRLAEARDRTTRPGDLFHALLLGPILLRAFGRNLCSLSPDLAVFALGIVASGRLLRALTEPALNGGHGRWRLWALALIGCVGITVKTSLAPLGVLAPAVAFGVWSCRGHSSGRGHGLRMLAVAAAIALAVLGPWAARGIVLSGYPLYPLALGGADVAWRVPRSLAMSEANWIKSWARRPGAAWTEVLGTWTWFRPWLRGLPADVVRAGLLVSSVGAAAGVYRLLAGRRAGARFPKAWPFLVPAAGSLIFWFFTAPDPRFAGAAWWVLAVGTVVLVAVEWNLPSGRLRWFDAALCGAVFLYAFQPNGLWFRDGRFEPLPAGRYRTKLTDGGVAVNVSLTGQCWNAPLPSTPVFRPGLRAFDPGDAGKGFFLDDTMTYADIHAGRVPCGMTAAPGIGVARVQPGGWDPYDAARGVNRLRENASLLFYTEREGPARLELIIARGSGLLTVKRREGVSRRCAMAANTRIDVPLFLSRGFTIVDLAAADENAVVEFAGVAVTHGVTGSDCE
jgi:hypothetical protein